MHQTQMKLVVQHRAMVGNRINKPKDYIIITTMKEIFKAHFESDDNSLRFTMPIAKVDAERRVVSGFATLDNIDRQGDKLLSEASREAFDNFRGNVRLMHQPIPAGKVISFKENNFYDPKTAKTYSGVFVDAYISKGAENVWQMVLDGTLTGFSIGGRILESEPSMDDETDQPIRLVKKYELMELSLVDSPANQFANILSIQKVNDEVVTSGIATSFSVENIFWCAEDEIAIPDSAESMECSICHKSMENVGWVESNDPSKDEEIAKCVDSVMIKSMHEDEEMKKQKRVVENHPMCNSGFAIVDEDGELEGCFESREVAEAALRADMMDDMDDDMDMSDKQVISTETGVPTRNAQQGLPGGVSRSMRRRKKKVIYKAERGSVSTGDFVAYAVPKPPAATQYAKGKVESIKTSGSVKVRGTNESVMATEENPVAIVRVYRQTSGNKYVPTDRRVAKNISNLRKLKPLQTKMHMEKAEPSSVQSRLNELVTQHNQKYGSVASKRVTVSMLRQVYNRGIGAYRTNPGSVRPNVASAEQWAYARVNGFLQAVRTGRFKRKPFDTDLLPSGHPLSTKANKDSRMKKFRDVNEEGGVEVADNVEAQELDTAEVEEVEFEVEESVEEVDEADEELAKAVDAEDLAVDTSEQIDLEKAFGEVKSFINDALAKSAEASKEGFTVISESISELLKSFDEKVGQLSGKYEELAKSIADISKGAEELAARVESVEEDTAMKKSGELENSTPEQPVMKKSLWGGRFLNSADL